MISVCSSSVLCESLRLSAFARDLFPSARGRKMAKSVVVLSTLDTKGRETAFLREQIEHAGCKAVLVDMGVVGRPTIQADITREAEAEAGGTGRESVVSGKSGDAG